jgi:large subunit ribosomal protein L29
MASAVVKAADLRGRTEEELNQLVKEKQEELFRLRFQHATGQLENVMRMEQVRREVARAKTILTEKKGSGA